MRIIFSFHALQQIKRRKIHKLLIIETVKFPDTLINIGTKQYAIKKFKRESLKVVYVKEKHIKIITSYYIK